MRLNLSLALAVIAGGTLAACENGPHQTYTPPPAGAANVWNNGDTNSNPLPGSAGSSTQGFTGTVGGNNASQICTGSQQAAAWAHMDQQPIILPNQAAGLNEAGQNFTCTSPGDCGLTGLTSWTGLTIQQAEQINCQGTEIGDVFGDGNQNIAWGGNYEVNAEYIVSSNRVDLITLDLFGGGYLGTLTVTSPYVVVPGGLVPGSTKYVMSLNMLPIEQTVTDSSGHVSPTVPTRLDWEGYFNGTDPDAIYTFDNIFRAIMVMYFSGLPQEPLGTTCDEAATCEVASFPGSSTAYLYVPNAGFGFEVAPYTDPNASQLPDAVLLYLTQIMNYDEVAPYLQLNAAGPVTLPQLLGQATTPCSLFIGLEYGAFLQNCVQTDGNDAQNQVELNKLLSGLTHDDETFNFDIPGVDLNYNDDLLQPTQVITDWDPGVSTPTPLNSPQPGDTANELNVDQSTAGNIANDWVYDTNGNALGQDLHTAGAFYDEYRRLVMVNVYNESNPNLPPMDPASPAADSFVAAQIAKCIPPRNADGSLKDFPTPGSGVFDPAAWATYEQGAGCTGVENMISAETTTPDDPVNVGWQLAEAIDSQYGLGLKMGHQEAAFCIDAASFNQAIAPNGGLPQFCTLGNILSTTATQVWAIWGQGNVNNMPIDIRDYRFFFKMYGQALIKTLEWAGDWTGPGTSLPLEAWTPPALPLKSYPIEFNDLFFDSIGAGQYETFEYVDRRFVCPDGSDYCTPSSNPAWQPALDINFTADVIDGIMNNYDITEYYYRGETALYQAYQQADPSGTPYALSKKSDTLLTNIVGSPVILSSWPSYACATLDPNDPGTTAAEIQNCGGLSAVAPVDSSTGFTVRNPDGNLLLSPYTLAFPDASGNFDSPLELGSTNMEVNTGSTAAQSADFEFEQAVLVTVPTLLGATATDFLPYYPSQPSVGFSVAVNGQYDQFVQTAEVDFVGVTTDAVVDYVQVPVSSGSSQTVNEILAVESEDYLGDVFMCRDATSGDVLTVRMYDTVAGILDWLNSHPDAYAGSESTECNMIVRWSPYDNYINLIESTTNGVRLQLTQGGGFGRVVGVTTYLPGNYGVE